MHNVALHKKQDYGPSLLASSQKWFYYYSMYIICSPIFHYVQAITERRNYAGIKVHVFVNLSSLSAETSFYWLALVLNYCSLSFFRLFDYIQEKNEYGARIPR